MMANSNAGGLVTVFLFDMVCYPGLAGPLIASHALEAYVSLGYRPYHHRRTARLVAIELSHPGGIMG